MQCPFCNKNIDADVVFCEFCGKELSTQSYHKTSEIEKNRLSTSIAAFDISEVAKTMLDETKQANTAYRDESVQENPLNRCNDLRVEYAVNRFLLAGAQMSLEMRIKIESHSIKSVFLWFVTEIGEKKEVKRIPTDELCIEEFRPVIIPCYIRDTDLEGMVTVSFYFACISDQDISFYQMAVKHVIYKKGLSTQSIIANISADGGSVVDMRNLKSLASGTSDGDALLERANREPPQYKLMPLTTTNWRPEREFIEGSPHICDMLTLEYNGCIVHIIGKKIINIGRKHELNDIVILDYKNGDNDNEWPNNTVSRKHARIEYCGDTVALHDYSSFGTFINEKNVKTDENSIAMLPEQAELKLGDIKLYTAEQMCGHRGDSQLCQNCIASKIKSLVISREEYIRESFIFIWECCSLSFIAKELKDYIIYRRNESFIMRLPDGHCFYLIPGTNICHDRLNITVKTFKQHNF